jgi:RNA polymerase sigma-70 factor (ECF subfamily)
MARVLYWLQTMKRTTTTRRTDPKKAATREAGPDQVRFGEREREYVFSVAMKYVKDEEEAADVAQDAMLLAFRHRDSFRGDSRFTTWLYRVAATTALMHLRKKRRMPKELTAVWSDESDERTQDALADVPAPGSSPEDEAIAHQALEVARDRLDAMGDKYGDVFLMRFRDGYSESEIARKLKLNVGTVKTRAYRARTGVRSELEEAMAA